MTNKKEEAETTVHLHMLNTFGPKAKELNVPTEYLLFVCDAVEEMLQREVTLTISSLINEGVLTEDAFDEYKRKVSERLGV